MKVIDTILKGVKIIEPDVFGDNRGWFTESYSKRSFEKAGLFYDFVQDNHSFSKQKGVIRGLHYQAEPFAQAKLVRCTKGSIIDFAVDIRKGSNTYLKHVAITLSEENHKQLMIPRGYAHGFITLTDDVEIQYKADNFYNKESDRSIRYNDSLIGINWDVENPILSDKDKNAPLLKDIGNEFSVKVLVTGANGQLGSDVVKILQHNGINVKGVDIQDFDITDFKQTEDFIINYNPDVVIHCAAFTAVDLAETEKEKCKLINVDGSKNIAEACKKTDAIMIYISTDYVYGNNGSIPIKETEKTNPLCVYGETKLEGEKVCSKLLDKLFIIRTSWVFGINGNNFVKTMLRLADKKKSLFVVNDQIGSPTYTPDLAEFIYFIMQTDKYGIYNFSNDGYCSWFDFANEIFKLSGKCVKVNPISTREYNAKAVRPLNSRLNKDKLIECGYKKPPLWNEALKKYFKEINK